MNSTPIVLANAAEFKPSKVIRIMTLGLDASRAIGANLPAFLTAHNLKLYIGEDLVAAAKQIEFRTKQGERRWTTQRTFSRRSANCLCVPKKLRASDCRATSALRFDTPH
ncbi:hypothetical protein [Bradyrhizobium yuanmingense]|uniref:hypothetical protein n=1 Tax=Bradyrhizobium yuanmingense TaxID=108015 RepID=UPI0023B8CCF7|nr:hypothetical protein [Bradyrhizobium yuanmingense]MDF0583821.1 hypothetical protein [Bradyrhizobium yuanmingense]